MCHRINNSIAVDYHTNPKAQVGRKYTTIDAPIISWIKIGHTSLVTFILPRILSAELNFTLYVSSNFTSYVSWNQFIMPSVKMAHDVTDGASFSTTTGESNLQFFTRAGRRRWQWQWQWQWNNLYCQVTYRSCTKDLSKEQKWHTSGDTNELR